MGRKRFLNACTMITNIPVDITPTALVSINFYTIVPGRTVDASPNFFLVSTSVTTPPPSFPCSCRRRRSRFPVRVPFATPFAPSTSGGLQLGDVRFIVAGLLVTRFTILHARTLRGGCCFILTISPPIVVKVRNCRKIPPHPKHLTLPLPSPRRGRDHGLPINKSGMRAHDDK